MGRLLKFLKAGAKIGVKAAPVVLETIYPPASGIIDFIQKEIIQAEADLGPGNGGKKKEQVLGNAKLAMPLLLPMMERMLNVDVDDELFMESVGKLIDGCVGLANSMKQFPRKA